VTSNAGRHRNNPAFTEDAISTVRHVVDKMSRLLAQLRSAMRVDRLDRVQVSEVLREAVAESASRDPRPHLTGGLSEEAVVYADRDRLIAVIGHIIQNAQEATRPTGRVIVRLLQRQGLVRIEVSDDGIGMEASFVRNRLFKPFDSTKGLSGMGIGAYECREVVRAVGGRIEVSSSPGNGTTFAIMLPLAQEVQGSRPVMKELG
jgi:putative PEP-CTERM system histidine kinase